MTEHRNPSHRPTLDDYCAMMRDTRASDQLKDAVLDEARARRRRGAPGAMPRRRPAKPIAVAACLILAVGLGAVGMAFGLPSSLHARLFGAVDDASPNSFALAAYATENPEGASGTTVTLDSRDFTGGGGYSGPWYNPADDTFWSDEWAGYKYHFLVNCVGNNIETVTYEIEGERSYFETIDQTLTDEQRKNGAHTYRYTKTVTFDYDHQESADSNRIVEIYIGFPLSDSGLEAHRLLMSERDSKEADRQLNVSIEESAAKEMASSKLNLTATFADGSTQMKSYVIAPVPDFTERYLAYYDAREAFRDVEPPARGASDEEVADFLSQMPPMPKLYAITEVVEE